MKISNDGKWWKMLREWTTDDLTNISTQLGGRCFSPESFLHWKLGLEGWGRTFEWQRTLPGSSQVSTTINKATFRPESMNGASIKRPPGSRGSGSRGLFVPGESKRCHADLGSAPSISSATEQQPFLFWDFFFSKENSNSFISRGEGGGGGTEVRWPEMWLLLFFFIFSMCLCRVLGIC